MAAPHSSDAGPPAPRQPGWLQRRYLHWRLRALRRKRKGAQVGGLTNWNQPQFAGRIPGEFRAGSPEKAQLIQQQIEAIEARLGIRPVGGYAAHSGQELAQDVQDHAGALANWREEDERLGRKR